MLETHHCSTLALSDIQSLTYCIHIYIYILHLIGQLDYYLELSKSQENTSDLFQCGSKNKKSLLSKCLTKLNEGLIKRRTLNIALV